MFSRVAFSAAPRALAIAEPHIRILSGALTSQGSPKAATSPGAVHPASSAAAPRQKTHALFTASAACLSATPEAATDSSRRTWNTVAGLSPRTDILNLRATGLHAPLQGASAVATMRLLRGENMRMFTLTENSKYITTLCLPDPDDSSLNTLAAHLEKHPRSDLTLQVVGETPLNASTAARVSKLTLAALHLDVGSTDFDPVVLMALGGASFPVALRGRFARDAFLAASLITSLTKLEMTERGFDDASAALFASHPSLQTLSIKANWDFSSFGMHAIASLGRLRELRLDEWGRHVIDDAVARALAANPRLAHLEIVSTGSALTSSSLEALSHSQTLKHLSIPMTPSMPALANLHALEHLTLRTGPWMQAVRLDAETASIVANLPKLRSLTFSAQPD